MAAGEPFDPAGSRDVERAVQAAERTSGLRFSLCVGHAQTESRPTAELLHAALPDSASSVLILVDPADRRLEIVTGTKARQVLSDSACALAALAMTERFRTGDLVAGIVAGLAQLGEHARPPETRHSDTPH